MNVMAKRMKIASGPLLSQPLVIALAILIAIAAIWFFAPYIGVICMAALMAFIFFPIYKFLSKYMPEMFAAWAVLALNIVIILVPVLYIGMTIVQQGVAAASAIANIDTSAGSEFSEAAAKLSSMAQSLGLPAEGNEIASASSITEFVQVTIPSVVTWGIQAIVALVVSVPAFLTSLIIYSFLFSSFLRFHKQAIRFVGGLSPFDGKTTDLYLRNSGMMVTASLKGQFVISFVTAVLSAVLLIFIGFGPYFWLLLILFTVLGMIPLGSGIVVIPLCLISMVVGDFWASFWVLAIYLLVVCNLDSFLRPKLIPKEAGIVPALAVLATFCGIYYFGLFGVVYGPLIVILLLTTANVLIDHKNARLA